MTANAFLIIAKRLFGENDENENRYGISYIWSYIVDVAHRIASLLQYDMAYKCVVSSKLSSYLSLLGEGLEVFS